MTIFERLKAEFDMTWTTILVGWTGLGIFSPSPDQWREFPPLLSIKDLAAFANERLVSTSDIEERDLIIELLALNLPEERRETIGQLLRNLSELAGGDSALELRKWRVVSLELLLEDLPRDEVEGLSALSEFWLDYGFPADSPHEVQGRGNAIAPRDYYTEENFSRLLARHRSWMQDEMVAIHNSKSI